MAQDRPSLNVVTPRGIAVYPKLNKPDTKFDADGVYESKLRLPTDSDDAVVEGKNVTQAAFFEALEQLRDEFLKEKKAELAGAKDPKAKAKAKTITAKDIGEPALDDDGEETGERLIKAKMKASGIGKKGPWTREPKLFDAKNKAMDINGKPIYGGSTIKVAAKAVPYYMAQENAVGVTLYMEAVQVLDLVSAGGRSATAYGFGAEEGYASPDEDEDDTPFAEGASRTDNDDF